MNQEKLSSLALNNLHRDRVIMLYEHIREGTLSYYVWSIAILSILILGDADIVGITSLGIFMVAVQVIKSIYMRNFFALENVEAPDVWERYMVIASFIQAFTVSAGVMILIDLHQNIATYILITLITIPAFVSALVLIASIQTHYMWLLGLLLPVAVKSGFADDPIYWVFSGLIIFGAVPSSALIGRKVCASFIETLRLRYENLELLESVRKEQQRAEKASADKTRFLASASHDLRQPIHALELFSDALEHELDKPIQFELMAKMKESTVAMNGLLYSLLDISRLDAEVVKVNKAGLLVDDLLERLIQSIQPLADSKGIKIIFFKIPCAVISDAVLLESILHNLLSNAVKYTNQGCVEVLCKPSESGKVEVNIKDSGIGIAEQDKVRVFDEFVQLDNPERDRDKGLGLGLAIVKRTCELLGHHISLQSKESGGSTFTLVLDAAQVADIEQLPTGSVQVSSMSATVLVIDDERAILEGMEKMLSRWGCEVLTGVSLEEALTLLEGFAQPIDLIIADYRLGEGRLGTDAIAVIKQTLDNPNVPAIMITGDTGSEQLQDIEHAGFHVLHKPVAPMRMRVLMQNLLKQAKNRRD